LGEPVVLTVALALAVENKKLEGVEQGEGVRTAEAEKMALPVCALTVSEVEKEGEAVKEVDTEDEGELLGDWEALAQREGSTEVEAFGEEEIDAVAEALRELLGQALGVRERVVFAELLKSAVTEGEMEAHAVELSLTVAVGHCVGETLGELDSEACDTVGMLDRVGSRVSLGVAFTLRVSSGEGEEMAEGDLEREERVEAEGRGELE
jgi:hypothetical protein